MIVFNGIDLIFLAIGAVILAICGVIFVADRIACSIKKRQQKRIDDAYKEEGE